MNTPPRSEVTRLLLELTPDNAARSELQDRLLGLVYDELRRTARGLMRRERVDHTLQPTALVHEAWMKLVEQDSVAFNGRAHFLGIAARCMRQVLVDHARAHGAEKRGGDRQAVTLDENMLSSQNDELELLALDDALSRLAELDERAAQVAERRLFGGMTIAEIAADLDVSKRTIDGDWSMARLWLSRELSEDSPSRE